MATFKNKPTKFTAVCCCKLVQADQSKVKFGAAPPQTCPVNLVLAQEIRVQD